MNSKLMEVRIAVSTLSQDAERMAAELGGLRQRFGNTAAQVHGSIGGSARQADRKMIASLKDAEKQLETAIAALQRASTEGRTFASSL